MQLIGLISDTHGVFAPQIREFLSPCDQLWHAGDFGGGLETAREIASFKPLTGVYGNCDDYDLRYEYPEFQVVDCEGLRTLMIHIGGHPGKYSPRARMLINKYRPGLFVCGHSHILRVEYDSLYEMMTLNPGACGLQGWQLVRTALRFKIEKGTISDMEVFKLPMVP